MVNPMPTEVKDLLSKLPAQQQVVLRQYIATLRASIVDLEDEVRTLKEPPPAEGEDRGHYHGEKRRK